MNNVNLIGRLVRDVELRFLPGNGMQVSTFTLAVDREFSKDGKKETDFIDIQVWGKSAENCANYIGKGSLVAIQGSIRIESYQNQAGENRTGCIFCAFGCHLEVGENRFQRLKNTHPKLHKYCMDQLGMREVLQYIDVEYE